MRAMLFHNPSAGFADHSGEDLIAALDRAGFEASYCSTKEEAFEARLNEPADVVVIAGGDGTVARVATRMPDRNVPLAIIPLGTANNIAYSLDCAGGAESIISHLHRATPTRLDLGLARGSWGTLPFIEAVGVGALAHTTAKVSGGYAKGEEKLRVGRNAFRKRLERETPVETTLELDDERLPGRWLAIEILISRYTGPRLRLCPDAAPGDGQLDVFAIGEEQRGAMMDWLSRPDRSVPPVKPIQARRVRFDWDGETPLRIDDALAETPGDGKPVVVTVELQEQPLRVLVPERAANGAGRAATAMMEDDR